MKRVFSISFSLLFLLSTVGLTINTHFCPMLNKSEVSLFIKKSCCNGKEEKGGCCKNETKIIKITDNYSPSVFSLDFFKTFNIFLYPKFISHSFDLDFLSSAIFSTHSPPPALKFPPIFILQHSFLI